MTGTAAALGCARSKPVCNHWRADQWVQKEAASPPLGEKAAMSLGDDILEADTWGYGVKKNSIGNFAGGHSRSRAKMA